MDIKSIWSKVAKSDDYQEWKHKHDAFEQIAIIKSWSEFEEYDVTELCRNDAMIVVALYCYIHFVLGVEFMVEVYDMAQDTEFEENYEDDLRTHSSF